MAKFVTVSLVGSSSPKVVEATTAGDALSKAGVDANAHAILVNGESSEQSRILVDYDFVSASLKVKGNC